MDKFKEHKDRRPDQTTASSHCYPGTSTGAVSAQSTLPLLRNIEVHGPSGASLTSSAGGSQKWNERTLKKQALDGRLRCQLTDLSKAMKHLETAKSSGTIPTKGSRLEVIEAGLTSHRLIPAKQKVYECESPIRQTFGEYVSERMVWYDIEDVVQQRPGTDYKKIRKLYYEVKLPGTDMDEF